jgi:hypothetical protein
MNTNKNKRIVLTEPEGLPHYRLEFKHCEHSERDELDGNNAITPQRGLFLACNILDPKARHFSFYPVGPIAVTKALRDIETGLNGPDFM